MKLFGMEKTDFRKIYYVFGIKIKFKDKIGILQRQIDALKKQLVLFAGDQKSLSQKIAKNSEQYNQCKHYSLELSRKNVEIVHKIEQKNTELTYKITQLSNEFNAKNNIVSTNLAQLKKNIIEINRDKNLAVWRINYLADYIGCKQLQRLVVKQIFFYNNNIYTPDIDNPTTFNEKILWLRENYLLNNHLTDTISDKLLFKEYIRNKLGDGYTIPLLGKWENAQDIDFDALPDSFVLKSTWGGDDAQVMLVEDKSKLDIAATRQKITEWLAPWGNPYYYAFTPIFKNIKPCIIAEEFIKTNNNWMLDDYKFFCFNGKFRMGYVNIRRRGAGKICYFDADWNFLPITYSGFAGGREYFPEKPKNFDTLVKTAEKLAAEFPFVRVDFFITPDGFYVGEMTFTPGGGMGHIDPVEWDYKLGEMLDISYLMEKKHD